MAVAYGPITRQSVDVGIGGRFRAHSRIGIHHDPAQGHTPIATEGGNLSLLWLAEDEVGSTNLVNVDDWATRNKVSGAPGLNPPVALSRVSMQPPTESQGPLRNVASPGVIGNHPAVYLSCDPGESTFVSTSIIAGYVLTHGNTVSGKDTITGLLIARAVDMDGDANVLRVHNSGTGEDFKIRCNGAGSAWELDSDGSGHSHTIGGASNQPMNGSWQVIRFGYRSSDEHYLQVGQRTEATASGTSGYAWGNSTEDITTIELFPGNADDEVDIACAFFCFGDIPTGAGEAAISRWLNQFYSPILSN